MDCKSLLFAACLNGANVKFVAAYARNTRLGLAQ